MLPDFIEKDESEVEEILEVLDVEKGYLVEFSSHASDKSMSKSNVLGVEEENWEFMFMFMCCCCCCCALLLADAINVGFVVIVGRGLLSSGSLGSLPVSSLNDEPCCC